MNLLREHPIDCPYCGETITLLVDCSEPAQCYVEDCHVCCQPILLDVQVEDEDSVFVTAMQENG